MENMQNDLFPKPAPLTLTIQGIVPSFKNNKLLLTKDPRGRPLKRPLLITKPEYQKKMRAITASFVSQLRCAFRTDSGATLTGCSLRSAIACALPEDDAWTHIPEIHIRAEICEESEAGAEIVIERIN
jgi:hypothetical protein